MAQHQVVLDGGPPQIEVTVLEAEVFGRFSIFVEHERGRFGRVENAQLTDLDFDLSGFHFRVDRPFGAGRYLSLDGDNVLAADAVGFAVGFRVPIRIEGQLDDSLAVTQVDENQAAVVATALNPAHKANVFAYIFGGYPPAVMTSFPVTKNVVQGILPKFIN